MKIKSSTCNFIFNKFSKRFFSQATSSQIKVKESTLHPNVDYKPTFFLYKNLEYRALFPTNLDQTVKEFLEKFAEGKSKKPGDYTSKDFEVVRNGHYLPLDFNISNLATKTYDKDPLTVLDEKLTLNNIRFRGLNHLSNPLNTFSNSFQEFLNTLLQTSKLDAGRIDKKNIQRILKSLDNIRGNNTKLLIALTSYLDMIQQSLERKYAIRTNYILKLGEFNKNDKKNVILLENLDNALYVPINVIVARSEEEKQREFNENIIDNMDTLRKLSIKFDNVSSNIGIVTDFYTWKFTFYQRPGNSDENDKSQNDKFESPSDYMTSLKYDLSITSENVNESYFLILSKILHGILSLDREKINSLKFKK